MNPEPPDENDRILVATRYLELSDDDPIPLDRGGSFGPIRVAYETYGRPTQSRDNAVLILHAFSGDAHAAGYHSVDDRRPGWWDWMIGPGRAIDTDRYYVICSNVLGGCAGTTGPSSISPDGSRPYGLRFPIITIRDMVTLQAKLLQTLGIARPLAVIGGSMGGMQALQWSIRPLAPPYGAIVIGAAARLTPQGIAFDAVGRNAIMSDPRWRGGDYYGDVPPTRGLAIARMVGHITYLSEEAMRRKFGRRLQERDQLRYDFEDQYQVESYLEHQGNRFVDRFDANSYIYLTKAMDHFDLSGESGSLEATFASGETSFLVVSYSTDWLYPPERSRELVRAMTRAGRRVSYIELDSPYGHDSFLLEDDRQAQAVGAFLNGLYERVRCGA